MIILQLVAGDGLTEVRRGKREEGRGKRESSGTAAGVIVREERAEIEGRSQMPKL